MGSAPMPSTTPKSLVAGESSYGGKVVIYNEDFQYMIHTAILNAICFIGVDQTEKKKEGEKEKKTFKVYIWFSGIFFFH